MKAREYYKVARACGLRAVNAIELAREAEDLDMTAARLKAQYLGQDVVSHETMPDGSSPIRLSFGIKVY
jgi:hypothetical protein